MIAPDRTEFTALLSLAAGGDAMALGRLTPLVYEDLRGIAHRLLRGERPGHTLQTTALVHEAYLRLVDGSAAGPEGRTHFLGLAATVMRRVLIDYARQRAAAKRGGGVARVEFEDALHWAVDERAEDLIALDEALDRLNAVSPRLARVVECRFFGGMTETEVGAVLGVDARTVRRDWVKAKGWLSATLRAD